MTAVVSLVLTAPAAHAALRSPQVPVAGTALQTFFASQGQAINVHADQLDLQQLAVPPSTSFEVRVFASGSGSSFGLYDAAVASPALDVVLPASLTPGWFATAAFRTSPSRIVVNLFDALGTFQGTNTYLGADPSAFGFYDAGATGTFYTQDARNPGGSAKILAYNGTGTRAGWTWFACESSAGAGGDFADFVAVVNLSLAPVPVGHANWGTLKRRFR